MEKFPELEEQQYVKTRRRIHGIAELIGRFREVLVQPIAKNDNLWLSVVNKGFCTPPMNNLNELEIGFNAEILCVEITTPFVQPSIKIKLAPEVKRIRASSKPKAHWLSIGIAVRSMINASNSSGVLGATSGLLNESSIIIQSRSMLDNPSNIQMQQENPQIEIGFV